MRGTKVLVTGADGFIGSHLVETLAKDGADVRAFVFYNPNNSWGWLDTLDCDLLSVIDVVPGDVRDFHSVRKASADCEIIFHLAALISIPYSYSAVDSYIATNMQGTINVLHAARDCGTSRVLITSTSEVYGSACYVPIDESHPLQAQSPYAASKIGGDKMAEAFYLSFGLPVTVVRPFNTYGPRQSVRAVIPTIITQLLSGSDEVRLGSLSPTRDFVYVIDTVSGFIRLAGCKQAIGQVVNIATGTEIAIGDLASSIINRIRPRVRIDVDEKRLRPDTSEVQRLCGANENLLRLTGWMPQTDLEHGLEQTIQWFQVSDHFNLAKAQIYYT